MDNNVLVLAGLIVDMSVVEVDLGCPTSTSIVALTKTVEVLRGIGENEMAESCLTQIEEVREALKEQGINNA